MPNHLITIVVVIYQEKISDLPIYALLEELSQSPQNYYLVIFDNSPVSQNLPFSNVEYLHDPDNPGLAKAYNFAWKSARENKSNAVLLLDQDSQLTKEYFQIISKTIVNEVTVPLVFSDSKQISPLNGEELITGKSHALGAGEYQKRVMAINSGSLIPMTVLEKIGGFNEEFPLDYLDHWFYWKLSEEKLPVRVIDYRLEHQLSVLDYGRISLKRYQSILTSEERFYTKYDTTQLAQYKKHLLKRILKQLLTVKNKKIYKMTWKTYRRLKSES